MLQVCIEDTAELCEATQVKALISHLLNETNAEYVQGTTRWSKVRERLDGKYDTIVCVLYNYTGMTVQNYNVDDYASSDE